MNNASIYAPLSEANITLFEYFIKSGGVEKYFNHDIIEHWKNLDKKPLIGWERFLVQVVKPKMDSRGIINKVKQFLVDEVVHKNMI